MILYTPVPVELLFSISSREFKEVTFGEAKIITEVDAEDMQNRAFDQLQP